MSVDVPRAQGAPTPASASQIIGFRWEREMLPPLAASVGRLVASTRQEPLHVLAEVASAAGVPDLVAVRFDQRETDQRLAASLTPVEDLTHVRALLAVASGALTVTEIATVAGVTAPYLRRSVLPALVEAGWFQPIGARGPTAIVTARYLLRPVATDLVTIEAKKAAWQRAINQAIRHSLSADASYLALDAVHASAAIAQRTAIRKLGIGLLTVDPATGQVNIVTRPRRRQFVPAMHMLLAERAWMLALMGKTAGPSFPVFGRDLTFP